MPSGPAPKDPSQRARRNKDPQPTRVIERGKVKALPLPAELRACAGRRATEACCRAHVRTRAWYRTWTTAPQTADWLQTDYLTLLDTAYLAFRFYSGDHLVASELRLRTGKWGATPEDRLRLRMALAPVAEPDSPASGAPAGARKRYGHLSLADESAVAGA